MYTGWLRSYKYPVNRPLTDDEKRDALSHGAVSDPSFDERGGLVALNSSYIEWIDRRFRARGAGMTFGTLLASLIALAAVVFALIFGVLPGEDKDVVLIASAACAGFLFLFFLVFHLGWGIDFFQKVYYPIRFNRKNRMIYVYRDKRDGGILQVPWESVYFHVGYGMMDRTLCDIRGEVLEGDTVKDTFAVGNYYPDMHVEAVRQAWSFICRYMDGGPEAVGPDPRDRYVENSLHGTWMDCAGIMYTNYPPLGGVAQVILGWPMIAFTTVTRWLVFKSCRMPKWPADIEAACKVESNDPNVWPQPKYGNQFMMEMPQVKARLMERRQANARRAADAAPKSDLTLAMANWDAARRKQRGDRS